MLKCVVLQIPLGVILKDESQHDDMISILETLQEYSPRIDNIGDKDDSSEKDDDIDNGDKDGDKDDGGDGDGSKDDQDGSG